MMTRLRAALAMIRLGLNGTLRRSATADAELHRDRHAGRTSIAADRCTTYPLCELFADNGTYDFACSNPAGHDGPCPGWPLTVYAADGDREDARRSPHCDDLVLHGDECRYCSAARDIQANRLLCRVLFTGEPARAGWAPCPSERRRTAETINRWPGNRAYGEGDTVPTY